MEAELERTLAQVMAPSSEVIKAASDRLRNEFYSHPETAVTLVHIMQHHESPQMRQLAGVEARKLLPRFWGEAVEPGDKALPLETQSGLKKSMLESTFTEPNELVRHTSARVVSAIACSDLDDGRWPELLPVLSEAALGSPKPEQREVAVYVLYTLMDADWSAALAEHASDLLKLFGSTVKDSSSEVRFASVLALCADGDMLVHSGSSPDEFVQYVPSIVSVLKEAVDAGDEKTALKVFESLSDLLASDPALLGDTFSMLLEHMLAQYAANEECDTEIRLAALRFIGAAVSYRMPRIKSLKAGPELVRALVGVMATDPADEDELIDEDDDEDTITRLAQRALLSLSTQLPPKQALQPLVQLLPTLVQSGDSRQLRAGYFAFSAAVPGAPEFVRAQWDSVVLPWIVSGLSAQQVDVRYAALRALSATGLELQDVVGEAHATLLPLVFANMDSASSVGLAFTACTCLDIVLGGLSSEDISRDYLHVIVPKLLAQVEGTPTPKLKGSVVQAIASAANSAGRAFSQYFDQTTQVLQKFIVPQPADLESAKLSGETLGAMGLLCLAVGRDQFRPLLQPCMEAALLYISSEEPALKDNVPMFLSSAAGVFGEEMAPFLPKVMPALFAIFEQQEITGLDDLDASQDVGGDEDDLADNLHVNTAVAVEKEYTCDCLSELWAHCPADVMRAYLEPTLKALEALSEHFFEDVRAVAIETAWTVAGSAKHSDVTREVWVLTASMLDQEDAVDTLSRTLDAVCVGLGKLGAAALAECPSDTTDKLLRSLFEVITKEHRAIKGFDDEEGIVAGEESSEAVVQLVTSALDLFVRLSQLMGEQFMPIFAEVFNVSKTFCSSAQVSERVMAIGALAEMVEHLGSFLGAYTHELLVVFGTGLTDTEAENARSVAAFGIGLLCASVPDDSQILPLYRELLVKIQQGLLQEEVEDARSTANALGCVARMSLRHIEAVPLEELIPLVASKLPLHDGYEEYPPIIELFAKLAIEGNPVVRNPAAIQALQQIGAQQSSAQSQKQARSSGDITIPLDEPVAKVLAETLQKLT